MPDSANFIDNAQTQLASAARQAIRAAKPYMPGDGTLLSALVGGGLGATLTGGAALAAAPEGEDPASRRKRVIREVLTGGGVGAAAGAALPTGINMLSGMLPERTPLGNTAETISASFKDGQPISNALTAVGTLPAVGSIFGRATGLYGAGKQHIRAQTQDFLHRFGTEYNTVQDKLRAEALAEINAAHPNVQSGAPNPDAVARLLQAKMDHHAPTQLRSILSEARARFGNLRDPSIAVPHWSDRLFEPSIPKIKNMNSHAEILAAINGELNKVNPNFEAAYTGKMQPHWAGGFGRRFLPSRGATAASVLGMLSPYLIRAGAKGVSKIDPMLDPN